MEKLCVTHHDDQADTFTVAINQLVYFYLLVDLRFLVRQLLEILIIIKVSAIIYRARSIRSRFKGMLLLLTSS